MRLVVHRAEDGRALLGARGFDAIRGCRARHLVNGGNVLGGQRCLRCAVYREREYVGTRIVACSVGEEFRKGDNP